MILRTLGLALVCALASCGYSTRMALPEGYHGIGVEYFSNESDFRDLEAELYDAMSLSMLEFVRSPLLAPDRADVVLRGRILEYRRQGGIRDEVNRLLQAGVRVVVEGTLWDRRTGKEISAPRRSTVVLGYVVGEGASDTSTDVETNRNRPLELESERQARARALRLVSDELILKLFADPVAGKPTEAP